MKACSVVEAEFPAVRREVVATWEAALAENTAALSLRTHVTLVGQQFAALFPGCLFEIRAIHPTRRGAVAARQFPCGQAGYVSATRWAAAQNRRGFNVYVGAAPRRPGLPFDGAASAADIVGAAFLLLDLDDLSDARATITALDPQPSLVVITGTIPRVRAQCWWPFEGVALDMPSWVTTQRALAARYGGDVSVCDAPRIGRLGGSISYPTARKQARGYEREVTSFVVKQHAKAVSAKQIERLIGNGVCRLADNRDEADDPFADIVTGRVPSEVEVRDLLSWIPPDLPRRDWIAVAGGLKTWASGSGEDGLALFITWSRGDLRRDGARVPPSFLSDHDCERTWDSLQ